MKSRDPAEKPAVSSQFPVVSSGHKEKNQLSVPGFQLLVPRSLVPQELAVAKTIHEMVVHQAHTLHEGVADG